MLCLNAFNCWKPLRAVNATARRVIVDANAKKLMDWAISSQAAKQLAEGSTTSKSSLKEMKLPRMERTFLLTIRNAGDMNNIMAKKKFFLSKEQLIDAYNEHGSLNKVAKEFSVSKKLVLNYMKRYKIETNKQFRLLDIIKDEFYKLVIEGKTSAELSKKYGVSNVSILNYASRLGIKVIDNYHRGYKIKDSGYVLIRKVDHPQSDKSGYVPEHRLVVEKQIGRYLRKDELIHHKNRIVDDNRIENLQIVTSKEHNHIHKPVVQRWERRRYSLALQETARK